jgi:hypothetical protein
MRYIKFIVLVVIFIVFMVFFYQNTAELGTSIQLKLHLLSQEWVSRPIPFYAMVLIAFGCGALLATTYFFLDKLRCGAKLREAREREVKLEKELNSLRNMPIEPAYPSAPVEDTSSQG